MKLIHRSKFVKQCFNDRTQRFYENLIIPSICTTIISQPNSSNTQPAILSFLVSNVIMSITNWRAAKKLNFIVQLISRRERRTNRRNIGRRVPMATLFFVHRTKFHLCAVKNWANRFLLDSMCTRRYRVCTFRSIFSVIESRIRTRGAVLPPKFPCLRLDAEYFRKNYNVPLADFYTFRTVPAISPL